MKLSSAFLFGFYVVGIVLLDVFVVGQPSALCQEETALLAELIPDDLGDGTNVCADPDLSTGILSCSLDQSSIESNFTMACDDIGGMTIGPDFSVDCDVMGGQLGLVGIKQVQYDFINFYICVSKNCSSDDILALADLNLPNISAFIESNLESDLGGNFTCTATVDSLDDDVPMFVQECLDAPTASNSILGGVIDDAVAHNDTAYDACGYNVTRGMWYVHPGDGSLLTVEACSMDFEVEVAIFGGDCKDAVCITTAQRTNDCVFHAWPTSKEEEYLVLVYSMNENATGQYYIDFDTLSFVS